LRAAAYSVEHGQGPASPDHLHGGLLLLIALTVPPRWPPSAGTRREDAMRTRFFAEHGPLQQIATRSIFPARWPAITLWDPAGPAALARLEEETRRIWKGQAPARLRAEALAYFGARFHDRDAAEAAGAASTRGSVGNSRSPRCMLNLPPRRRPP